MSTLQNDYVEASPGQKSLKFDDEKQQARFELGVCMAVYKWEELKTAVANLWGGSNSSEKRDWISGIVIDLFDAKYVDVAIIEETLLYAMFDEFDINVDNESAMEIGCLIVKFYKQTAEHDYSLIEQFYEKWKVQQQTASVNSVRVESDPENPSSGDDVSDNEMENDNEMELDGPPQPQEPIVDDDGFTLVQKRQR